MIDTGRASARYLSATTRAYAALRRSAASTQTPLANRTLGQPRSSPGPLPSARERSATWDASAAWAGPPAGPRKATIWSSVSPRAPAPRSASAAWSESGETARFWSPPPPPPRGARARWPSRRMAMAVSSRTASASSMAERPLETAGDIWKHLSIAAAIANAATDKHTKISIK
uniref:Uncharacterized protein n=1 Tax=Oryza meridionalis TaxID=40149 RepID=A0A0E0C860_9ORYZ